MNRGAPWAGHIADLIKHPTRRLGMAVEQTLSPTVEKAVKKIVQETMAAYGSELDRKIDLAIEKHMLASGTERAKRDEMCSCVEKAAGDALSDVPHLISAGYIPLGDDYWPLFVIHDSDNHGDITSDLIDKIVELEKLPSVPTLDLQLMHISKNAPIPSDATVIFATR